MKCNLGILPGHVIVLWKRHSFIFLKIAENYFAYIWLTSLIITLSSVIFLCFHYINIFIYLYIYIYILHLNLKILNVQGQIHMVIIVFDILKYILIYIYIYIYIVFDLLNIVDKYLKYYCFVISRLRSKKFTL